MKENDIRTFTIDEQSKIILRYVLALNKGF